MTRLNSSRTAVAVFLLSVSSFSHAYAEPFEQPTLKELAPEDNKAIFSVVFENDFFGGTDQNYTNGVRFSWMNAEETTPNWARWVANNLLPFPNSGKKRISITAGQNLYTPENLNATTLIPNDRPYAAWLYGSIGMVSDTGEELDNVMLTVGMVGPSALGEGTQKTVHDAIGSDDPRGWDNQLKDELGVILTLEHKWRALYQFTPFGVGADITPHVGVNLGNVNTDGSIGAIFRLGYDLPADYGPPRVRPSLAGSDFFLPTKTLGGYWFLGLSGRAVARDIFLDGNSFRDSPSVDKEPFVGSLQTGIAMTYREARISYTHVLVTREFEEQRKSPQFGVISVSWRF